MGHAPKSGKSRPVDWWFMYKIPRGIGPKEDSTGDEFLYCDDRTKLPAKGKYKIDTHRLDKPGSAMEQTLRQIYYNDPDVGYVV